MIGLGILLFLVFAAYCWWRLVKAREKARAVAGAACREHGLVLMDDTVVLDSLDTRNWREKRILGLQYRFDFAENGILRHGGQVLIMPRQPAMVVIAAKEGQIIESV